MLHFASIVTFCGVTSTPSTFLVVLCLRVPMGLAACRIKAFFHYRKRINCKILTHKRIKTGNFLSLYRAK